MMVQGTDLEVLRDIPGYKAILKALIKSQIQHLVEQLSSHTEEEAVLLTVCTADGSLSHLGSESGRGFLDANDDVKSKFLGFCLKQQRKIQSAESPIKPRPPVSQTQHSPANKRQKFSPYPAPSSPGYARNQARSFPQKPLPQTSPSPIMSSLAEYRQPPVSQNQTQNNTGVILKTESELDANSDQVAADSYPGYSTQTSQGYSTQTTQGYSTQTSQVYSTQTSQGYSTQTSQGDDTKAGMLQEHEDSIASVEADDSVNVKAEPNSDDELSIIGVDYGGGGGEGADAGQGEAGWLSGSEVGGASNDGFNLVAGSPQGKQNMVNRPYHTYNTQDPASGTVFKIYSCAQCSRPFKRKDYLDKHMLIHTGELPYKCQLCGLSVRHRSNFSVHMRRKHKMNIDGSPYGDY